MVQWNAWMAADLVNGAEAYVYDIIYKEGAGPPSLPECILLAFPDGSYRGPSYMPARDIDPTRVGLQRSDKLKIVKMSPQFETSKTAYRNRGPKDQVDWGRRQFRLSLSWAMTIHKGQGCTLLKLLLDLGPRTL